MNSGMMLKLSNLLRSRSQVFPRRLFDKAVREYFSLHSLVFQAGISTGPNTATDGKFAGRVFASYSVYKGKASVSASPRLPTFSKLDCGSLRVDRQGVIMLTFRPAIGERKYDWEKRQLFALSPTEVGSLLSLGAKDSCEFFHDPSMLSSNAGQVRKTLSVKAHADGSGYFFSLNVVNNLLKTTERLTVPVTTAEFAVMRAAFSYALPHIMGWDRCTNQLPNTTGDSPTKVNPQARHLEWER